MSIALGNKVAVLEKRVDEQRDHYAELAERIADVVARLAVLEMAAAQQQTRKPLKVA